MNTLDLKSKYDTAAAFLRGNGHHAAADLLSKEVDRLNRVQRANGFKIKCIETGTVYDTQSEACRMMDIDGPRLSKHLNGHPHFKKVGEFTFERVG